MGVLKFINHWGGVLLILFLMSDFAGAETGNIQQIVNGTEINKVGIDIDQFSTFLRQSEQLQIAQSQTIESRLRILNGAWEGSYHCSQGITRLRLVIEAKSTTDIDAVFIFSAHPKNPSVLSGSFRMEGIYNAFNSPEIPDQLTLRATTWINRPSNYQTVDLIGSVFLNEGRTIGEIPNLSGCSRFDVAKVENSR